MQADLSHALLRKETITIHTLSLTKYHKTKLKFVTAKIESLLMISVYHPLSGVLHFGAFVEWPRIF